MLAKRIIPCLDIDAGRVVKGTNFVGLRDAGDPVEAAAYYNEQGADELVVLDISASYQQRKTTLDIIKRIASEVCIPLTVGGGISSTDDCYRLLRAGADKVSVNSAALANPTLVTDIAKRFGSQCVVSAIDVKRTDKNCWEVFSHGGRKATGRDAFAWAKQVANLGAGEILLTSMDGDGAKSGYDLAITKLLATHLDIPVIASGGAGTITHLYQAFDIAKVEAVLAASIFHFREMQIATVKQQLADLGVRIRPV